MCDLLRYSRDETRASVVVSNRSSALNDCGPSLQGKHARTTV